MAGIPPRLPPVPRPAVMPEEGHPPHLAHAGRPKIRFSGTEILHLLVGVAVLTFAFSIVDGPMAFPERLVPTMDRLLAAFVAVTTGFVLHEIAHKIAAQLYGHWAEFRAAFAGLGFALVLAVVPPGFLAALPGATWIQGNVTRKQSGVISLVGPALNFVVAWAAFPFSIAINPDETVPTIFSLVALVNAVLAFFNMLPLVFFGVALDGRKVWRWNRFIWIAGMLACVSTMVYIYGRVMALW